MSKKKAKPDRVLFYKAYEDYDLQDLDADLTQLFSGDVFHQLPNGKNGKRGLFHISIVWRDDP